MVQKFLASVVMMVLTVALLVGFFNILFFLTLALALFLCIMALALPFVWVFKRWKAFMQERRVAPIRRSINAYMAEADERDGRMPTFRGENRISQYLEEEEAA